MGLKRHEYAKLITKKLESLETTLSKQFEQQAGIKSLIIDDLLPEEQALEIYKQQIQSTCDHVNHS